MGYVTRYPSIVTGTVSPQSQSYTTGGVMVPAEISPAALFAKLFLQGDAATVAREKQRLADGGSILDRLRLDAQALRVHANAGDAHKLDAYFEAVRTAERELVEVQAWLDRPKPIVDSSPPQDVDDPADLIGRVERMLDLVPLILATDSSRVISLMIQDHGAVPKVDGVNGEHHGLSHHGQDEAKIAQLKLVEIEIVKRFGALLDRLDERPDGGPSLLDSTTVPFRQQPRQRQFAQRQAPPDPRRGRAFRPRAPCRPRRRGGRAAVEPVRHLVAGLRRARGDVRTQHGTFGLGLSVAARRRGTRASRPANGVQTKMRPWTWRTHWSAHRQRPQKSATSFAAALARTKRGCHQFGMNAW